MTVSASRPCERCRQFVVRASLEDGTVQIFDEKLRMVLVPGVDGVWRINKVQFEHECGEPFRFFTETGGVEEEKTVESDSLVVVGGMRFCCSCGSSLFRRSVERVTRYRCNGCGAWYEGDE